jgi:hypothetical protein
VTERSARTIGVGKKRAGSWGFALLLAASCGSRTGVPSGAVSLGRDGGTGADGGRGGSFEAGDAGPSIGLSVSIEPPASALCAGQCVTLTAQAVGGVPPYASRRGDERSRFRLSRSDHHVRRHGDRQFGARRRAGRIAAHGLRDGDRRHLVVRGSERGRTRRALRLRDRRLALRSQSEWALVLRFVREPRLRLQSLHAVLWADQPLQRVRARRVDILFGDRPARSRRLSPRGVTRVRPRRTPTSSTTARTWHLSATSTSMAVGTRLRTQ